MPLLLLLMLPASLIVSDSLNFLGGAKSKAVKVLDFRSKCLCKWSAHQIHHTFGKELGEYSRTRQS